MLGNYFATTIDVVLYLGTTRRHRLLAPLYIVAELVFAGVYVGVDLCSCFSRFLLQVFGAFTRALGQTFPACLFPPGERKAHRSLRQFRALPETNRNHFRLAVVLNFV